MDQQREVRIVRVILAPTDDELFGFWVKVLFAEWRRVDGVEQLLQLSDVHLDHRTLGGDGVAGRAHSAFAVVGSVAAFAHKEIPACCCAGPFGPSLRYARGNGGLCEPLANSW